MQDTQPISPARKSELLDAANTLMDARREGRPLDGLPAALSPASLQEAYYIQDQMALSLGEIGGWKVGAPSAEATPLFAPMPLIGIGNMLAAKPSVHRYRGVEAEVAFLLGEDLPPRATPYTREEALAALASAHPGIEILESAFTDPMAVPELLRIADLQMHGAFVFGPACPTWKLIDFSKESVTLAIDGAVRCERTGSNTAGDLLRLLPWLANQHARTGGLRRGQWITTGSWTGNTLATAGSSADIHFATLGRVTTHFA